MTTRVYQPSINTATKELAEQVVEGAEKRLTRENKVREEIYNTDDILELNNRVGRW